MSKRIKKVFGSSEQVIHIWANQFQSDARSKNVFFSGASVYSYGTHYELGRLVSYKGTTVALINDRGYSVTTAKHIGYAYGAVSQYPRLKTKTMSGDVDTLVKDAMHRRQGELVDQLSGHFKRRSFWSGYTWDANEMYGLPDDVRQFNSLCDKLGFKDLRLDVTPEFIESYNEHVQYCVETKRLKEEYSETPEAIAEKAARQAKEAARALAKAASDIQAWRDGGPLKETVRKIYPTLIRVVNNEVQTARGASVPLDQAVRLLMLVKAGKAKQGEKVGHFTFTGLVGDTVKIGCHDISLSEAETVIMKTANPVKKV